MSTPEAEPKQSQSAGEVKLSNAQQQQIVDQLRQQQAPSAPAAPAETGDSMFHQTTDFFRGKIKNVLYTGAFLANPVVGTVLYLGDKVAQNTVAKIPVIGNAYTIPKNLVVGAGNALNEGITRTVALPAFAADRLHDVYQGITGVETTEARSFVGKAVEQGTELIGSTLKFAKEKGGWAIEQAAEKGQKALEIALTTIGKTLSIPYHMVHGAVEKAANGTSWAMAAGPTGVLTSAVTTALIGWGIWSFGMGMPAAGYWPWLGGIIQQGFAAGRTAVGL